MSKRVSTVVAVNPCKADFERRAAAFKDHTIIEKRGAFTRHVAFEPGYDHRKFPEACGGGGHGQHGMTIRFILIGELGATQWVFNLSEFVPGNLAVTGHVPVRQLGLGCAMAYDLGYHWSTPQYDSQTPYDCELLPGGKCYYDGSGLRAEPVLNDFIVGGPAAVWATLEGEYRALAGDHIGARTAVRIPRSRG